tara:strand:- start:10837 stop:11793 length:957 start_codon:yes stop_codon:yes gene_type:complete
MASAPIYCTHEEFKRVFPQLDEFDQKVPVYGWTEVSSNKYAAHDSGAVSQLFVDGESLGSAQSAHTDLNVEGEWFYNSTDDVLYYYSASTPVDKLMEAGELFTAMVTQFRTDASRYLDSRLDPKLPKSQWKNSAGEFDYIIVRTTALIAATFMVRSKDPSSELATSLEAEYENNIKLLNEGRASLGFQNTGDASMGIIRDLTYTAGKLRPVDLKGRAGGVDFDLIKVKVIDAGVFGTGTYSVWTKDGDQLKNNQVVTAEKITGDYQPLAHGLQIRFGGDSDSDQAAANDEWEVEVRGYNEEIDTGDLKGVKMTRVRYY